MKKISNQIEKLVYLMSEDRDPKPVIRNLNIKEREQYVINGKSLKLLLMMLVQFHNVLSMGSLFGEE